MMSLAAAILVATCTATFGLHSSSRTTISYSYFDLASALRSFTARSAELRPPSPLTETPPVSGPMKPTFTLSLASAVATPSPNASTARLAAMVRNLITFSSSNAAPTARPDGGAGTGVEQGDRWRHVDDARVSAPRLREAGAVFGVCVLV